VGVTFTVTGGGGAGGAEPTAPQERQIKERKSELKIKNRDNAENMAPQCAGKIPRGALL
jgi:hypothetical protein